MKSFIEVHVSSSPVLVSVSAISDIWPREVGGGTDIYTRSCEGDYIHASESYEEVKKLIRVALGEEEEPRPIYWQLSERDVKKLKAAMKEGKE